MMQSTVLSRAWVGSERLFRRMHWVVVALFFAVYLIAILWLMFLTGVWQVAQPYAEFVIQHPSWVRLCSSVLAAACAWFLFWPREGARFIGRWSDFVGLAFLTFSVQYGLRFLELRFKGPHSPGVETAFHYAADAIIYACSAANNLLFLAAARILLNKSKRVENVRPIRDDNRVFAQPKEKIINSFAEFKAAVPAWAWVVAAAALLALLDSKPKFIWARFPDAIFSVYCLSWYGYAIAVNLNIRRHKVLAGITMVIALAYGAGQLVYATNPITAYTLPPNRPTAFPLALIRSNIGVKIDELTVDTNKKTGRNDKPIRFLDGAVYAVLLPMKALLFLPAFFLYLLFFIVTINDIRPALFESIIRRKDYLSSDGIISAIGRGLGAKRVSLFIRIPGSQQLHGGAGERVLPLIWDAEHDGASKERGGPRPLSDSPQLIKIMKGDGKASTPNGDAHHTPYSTEGNYGQPWLVPIKFNGGVIGALQAELARDRMNHMTLQKLGLMADLIAPSVQDYRSIAALDQIGLRLTRLQVDYPKDSFVASTKRMADVLHDVLSPLATGLVIEIGFISIRHVFSVDDRYKTLLEDLDVNSWLKNEETQFIVDGESIMVEKSLMLVRTVDAPPEEAAPGSLAVGGLMLAIPAEKDEFSRPTLAAYYLNRKAVASLTTDGVLDLARDSLGAIIKDLGVEFSEETFTRKDWFNAISRAVLRAGLTWVVASSNDGGEAQGEQSPIEMVHGLSEEDKEVLLAHPLSSVVNDPPESETYHIIRLNLPKSKHNLWLGVGRAAFGPELNFESPWLVFLRDLAAVADAALDSVQRREEAEIEKLRAAQNQGVMTIAVTTGTLMHQLLNMIKDQLFATESLEEEAKEPDVRINAKCEKLLRTMKQSAVQMRELTEAFHSVTKMEGPRPCSIKDAAEQAVRLFKVSLSQRRIECKVSPSTAVEADVPFHVAAFALANLIGNAKDAIWYNGRIEIEAEDAGKFILCHVTNTGQEIPPELRETLFQFGKTSKRGHNGWGLYFVAKALIENGGGIELAYSDTRGTRFTLRLPKQRPN